MTVIMEETYQFGFYEQVVEEMKTLTKEDLLKAFRDIFKAGGKFSYQRFAINESMELPKEVLEQNETFSGKRERLIINLSDLQQYIP